MTNLTLAGEFAISGGVTAEPGPHEQERAEKRWTGSDPLNLRRSLKQCEQPGKFSFCNSYSKGD